MSLLVWLPLTDRNNYKPINQGVDDCTFSLKNDHNAIYANDDGLTCYCLERLMKGGSYNDFIRSSKNFNLTGDISMFCWLYVFETYTDRYYANGVITNHNHVDYSGVGLTVRYISASDYRISCSTGTGSSRTYDEYYGTTNIKSQWHHCGLTYNRASQTLKLWVDGNVEYTLTGYNNYAASNPFDLFNWSTGYVTNADHRALCRLNDVRLYDHELSQKEIKELAKGLTTHFTLNRQGSGGDNLFKNSFFSDKATRTNWDTSKNGTYEARNWGGYNGGVANPTTVYHAHLKEFQGEWVYEYIKTSAESWLGVSQGGLQSYIEPNTTYTWSIDEYRTSGSSNYITAGLYYKRNSSDSYGFYCGCTHGDGRDVYDEWVRRTYTFTTGDIYTGANMLFYIYGTGAGNGTIYMRRPKLEKGDHATVWMPISTDSEYINFGYDDASAYDTSGYINPSTKTASKMTYTGTISYPTDSARYSVATNKASGSYFMSDTNTTNFLPKDEITVSIWGRFSSWGATLISCTEGGGWNFETNGNGVIQFPVYVDGVGYKTAVSGVTAASLADSKWHMFTGSFSMNTQNVKIYIDGVLKATTSTGSGNRIKYASNRLIIGGEAQTTTPASSAYTGDLSDCRIYSRALSDADIKELYSVGASISNAGTIHGYELVEPSTNIKVGSEGIVNAREFIESGTKGSIYKNGDFYGSRLHEI